MENGSGNDLPFPIIHLNPRPLLLKEKGRGRVIGFLYLYKMVYIGKSRKYLLHLDAEEGMFEKATRFYLK